MMMLLLALVIPSSSENYFGMVGLAPEQPWPEPEDLESQVEKVLGEIKIGNPQPLFKKILSPPSF